MSTLHKYLDAERLAELARDPAEHGATGVPGRMPQDSSRKLTAWIVNKVDARMCVREALADIRNKHGHTYG